ncbi:MAG TPA: ATP-binding protein [Burkholderiaceae bacterium]|nr:ATP-binding protein [Burkholderiaceae bacterium]
MIVPKLAILDTLFGRVVLIVIIGLAAGYVLSATFVWREMRGDMFRISVQEVARHVDAAFRIARALPDLSAQSAQDALSTPEIAVSLQGEAAGVLEGTAGDDAFSSILASAIRSRIPGVESVSVNVAHVTILGPGPDSSVDGAGAVFGAVQLQFTASARLGELALHFASRPNPLGAARLAPPPALGEITIRLIAVLLCALVAAKVVTRPFADISASLAQLGDDVSRTALDVRGPVEARRLAYSFNEMRARLLRIIEQRTGLLAAISHDLRTPLTRARLRAEFLEDGEHKDKLIEHLDDMQQLLELTLDYTRAQIPRADFVPVDLLQVLGEARKSLAERGADVHINAEAVKVIGEPFALKRCFVNLLDNAVKYGKRAEVTVRVAEGGGEVVIEDRGPGIPQHLLEAVLEPFVRVEPSRNRDHGGIGLGLTIARDVIAAHKGRLTLSNAQPDGGLCVRVWLPS